MARKRTLQRIRRRLVYWGTRLVNLGLRALPFDVAIALGGWLGRLTFALLRRERQKTIRSLTVAFGREKSEAEIRAVAREVFVHAGRSIAEIWLISRWTEKRLRKRVQFENLEPLLEYARAGQGCVILTAHYGNWELLGLYAVKVLGLNMGVIARHLSNPHLDRMTIDHRERMGLKLFFRGDRATRFVRHLMQGGMLAILGDQDVRRLEGIFVDFFGHPAHTLTGPAELIVRTGVPWFISVLERNADGRSYRGIIDGPFAVPEGVSRETRVRRLTEQYMKRIEELIRERPEQWMWMHNRWQRKPEQ